MKCEYCSNEVPAGVTICPSCGAPVAVAAVSPKSVETVQNQNSATQKSDLMASQMMLQQQLMQQQMMLQQNMMNQQLNAQMEVQTKSSKNLLTYQLLALLFGYLGLHNFYADRYIIGTLQLLLTILSGGVGLIITIPWAWAEIFTVKHDNAGKKFQC